MFKYLWKENKLESSITTIRLWRLGCIDLIKSNRVLLKNPIGLLYAFKL